MRTYKTTIALLTAIIFTLSFDISAFGQRQNQQLARQTPNNANQGLSGRSASQQAAKGIQWYGNLYGAYSLALSQNKPLIAYFYFGDCRYCQQLETGAFMSAKINSLADKAVFVRVDIHMDDANQNVSKLIRQLKLERYPAVVVMDVYKDKIVERGRIIGVFEASEYYFNLTQILLNK